VFGLLGLGEGWHNNHHAFPTSARFGLAWWQLDCGYVLIRLLALAGLVWAVKLPPPEMRQRRLRGASLAAPDHSPTERSTT
jgi:stearoyl-CoA desaturase (delta-9 desaturase)